MGTSQPMQGGQDCSWSWQLALQGGRRLRRPNAALLVRERLLPLAVGASLPISGGRRRSPACESRLNRSWTWRCESRLNRSWTRRRRSRRSWGRPADRRGRWMAGSGNTCTARAAPAASRHTHSGVTRPSHGPGRGRGPSAAAHCRVVLSCSRQTKHDTVNFMITTSRREITKNRNS